MLVALHVGLCLGFGRGTTRIRKYMDRQAIHSITRWFTWPVAVLPVDYSPKHLHDVSLWAYKVLLAFNPAGARLSLCTRALIQVNLEFSYPSTWLVKTDQYKIVHNFRLFRREKAAQSKETPNLAMASMHY